MKTNIKLQVTPEQLKEVQLICFSNKIYWINSGSNFEKDTVKYIFISINAMALTYESTFFHKHKFEEVDASLFIRTKGSCVEEKKEIDLRNTWCYATVPNHDRLRLLGYNHNPVGCCKDYYYIGSNNKIIDLATKPEYKPEYREIVLNKQKEFEFTDDDKDHSEEMYIKVSGKEYVLTKEDQEYIYSKRPPSLPNTAKDQSATEPECQFTKYGFEKPEYFECEILKEYDDHLVGAVYQNEAYFGTSWTKKGTCLQTKGFGYTNMNLTPIKKPWYKSCKFPCLVWDEDNDLLGLRTREEYTASYLNECTPLTNDEIEGLKQ